MYSIYHAHACSGCSNSPRERKKWSNVYSSLALDIKLHHSFEVGADHIVLTKISREVIDVINEVPFSYPWSGVFFYKTMVGLKPISWCKLPRTRVPAGRSGHTVNTPLGRPVSPWSWGARLTRRADRQLQGGTFGRWRTEQWQHIFSSLSYNLLASWRNIFCKITFILKA